MKKITLQALALAVLLVTAGGQVAAQNSAPLVRISNDEQAKSLFGPEMANHFRDYSYSLPWPKLSFATDIAKSQCWRPATKWT